MSVNYNGLTRNIWTGTWSPSGNHPIALSNELRGGLQLISGGVGDQLINIPGQRLQDGTLVYVKSSYDNISGDTFYQYRLLAGETRDISSGAVPNNTNNWSKLSVGSNRLQDITDVSDIAPLDKQIIAWDANVGEWIPTSDFTGNVLSTTGFTLIDADNETFTGNVYGSIFADDSTILVDADSGTFTGTLYGSVFADDSTILVDAENGTISWHVLSDIPNLVEKTSDTGGALIPVGTDAERDVIPTAGAIRLNTTATVFEGYNGSEWVPFDKDRADQETILEFPVPGTYAVDIFNGDVYQTAEYKIQSKSAEGVEFSTFAVVFGGTPATTVDTEYGVIQTHDTNITNFYSETDVNNNITIFCNVLYSNTKVSFKKLSLTNN